MTAGRRTVRSVLAAVVFLSAATLVAGYVEADRSYDRVTGDPSVERAFQTGNRSPVVEPREAPTVIATDSNAFVGDQGDGPRARAELAALAPDGSIYYYEDRHTRYWDVDPVSGTTWTVEFVYADHLAPEECGSQSVCTRNGVERVNLSTGERTEVYSRVTPGKHATRWHDVDRIDEDRLLVADIDRDRAYVVNTTTDLIEWEWDARSDFEVSGGGEFPEDWTHLNDVEVVEIDERPVAMISLRNQDQVVFVDFERGLLEEWTLGADDDHETLYEQHNPDYIPPSAGGPAVLVADSENNRVIEYQREDGEWVRSWTWSDRRLQWPRDADRLPNGNTLVTDSNGDRVFEVNESGGVVWTASVGFPYEAERLGTDGESAGGESAVRAGLRSRSPADPDAPFARAGGLLPGKVANAVAYAMPRWVGPIEVVAAVALVLSVIHWLIREARWANVDERLRSRVRSVRR